MLIQACATSGAKPTTSEAKSPIRPSPTVTREASTFEAGREGRYVVLVGSERIGQETFRYEPAGRGWNVRTQTELSIKGVTIDVTGVLTVDPGWKPLNGAFVQRIGGDGTELSLRNTEDGLVLSKGGTVVDRAQRADVDFYLQSNVISHASGLCSFREQREVRFFPNVPATVRRGGVPFGAGTSTVIANVAGTQRLELLCRSERLVALRQPMSGVSAYLEGDGEAMGWSRGSSAPTRDKLGIEREQRVTLPTDGKDVEVGCTLELPSAPAPQKVPAVVFISGTGLQDRNGDTPGPGGLKLGLFASLADALARKGIASLRCDDPTDKEGSLDMRVRQVRAQVAAIRDVQQIDASRLALLGHSEGGFVALISARAHDSPRVLVLAGAPAEPIEDIILLQVEEQMREAGKGLAETRTLLDKYRSAFTTIRTRPRADAPDVKTLFGPRIDWLRSRVGRDPVIAAKGLRGTRVLVVQGGRDRQIGRRDGEKLAAAIQKGTGNEAHFISYDELDHLFAASKSGEIAEYWDRSREVSRRFAADVVEFLSRELHDSASTP